MSISKEEAEILKILAETKEIENKTSYGVIKTIVAGIVAGILLFASWRWLLEEYSNNKIKLAETKVELAEVETKRIEKEKQRLEEIQNAVSQNRDSIALSLKEVSKKLLKQGNQIKKQINSSSPSTNNKTALIKSVERDQNKIRQGLSNLELIGTTWNLIEGNNKDVITFLADGQILGYGKANDYWEISGNKLTLYTGGNKNNWTRKWESQVGNFLSGIGENKEDGTRFAWKLVKRE